MRISPVIAFAFGVLSGTGVASGQESPVEEPASLPAVQLGNDTNVLQFGSYGRIGAYTNQIGRDIAPLNILTYEPVLQKQPYIELWLSYEHRFGDLGTGRVVATPAFAGDPFHYTGQFSAAFALRNAYLEFFNIGGLGFYAWAGSRMYRGDIIQLLDFWPLDNVNTLGGGLGYRWHQLDVALHVGASEVLGSNFFNQQIQVANPTGVGTTSVETNDRQHLILSMRASYSVPLRHDLLLRAKLYGEGHSISAGAVELANNQTQVLPGDSGGLFGGELALVHSPSHDYLMFTARQAWNLGAYPALTVPFDLNNQGTTQGASETLVTLAGQFAWNRFTLGVGAYYRGFKVALSNAFDPNDRDEYELCARLKVAIFHYLEGGIEGTYQRTLPHGIEPDVLRQISPEVGKFSIIPAVVSNPDILPELQVALIYTYTGSNGDTQYLFPQQDVRYSVRAFHYFGIRAEWLFGVLP